MTTAKKNTVEQCDLAFTYIQKLYHEVSYLIKEVEGDLGQEPEEFVIGKTGGYQIVAKSSMGLESKNVDGWLRRKMSVFFIPRDRTTLGSTTNTPINDELRVVYMRVVLNDNRHDFEEPFVSIGVLWNIANISEGKKFSKFEDFPGYFEYNDYRIFQKQKNFHYKDSSIAFDAEFTEVDLFDIVDSEAVMKSIVTPALNLYRDKNSCDSISPSRQFDSAE